jgi:hypothetical protein
MKRGNFIIRDMRTKAHYVVDDEYLNGYARVCGVYATAVYNVLCRHADFHTQTSFPSVETMAEKLGVGRMSVLRALAVLEQYNIIKRERVRNATTARWKNNSYTLLDKSQWLPHTNQVPVGDVEEPSTSQVQTQVPVGDTKDTHRPKDTHTKPSAPLRAAKFTSLGADVIKAFEAVDPKNKAYYNRPPQREAADFLIAEYGFDQVRKRIQVLPKTNKLPYFPTITTPIQLRDKWVQLQDAVDRMRAQKITKGANVAFV